MPVTNSDAVLWYNVGIFGEQGYAVPNWSNDVGSLNPQILDLVDLVGRNLFAFMHHEDADLRVPPSINTLRRVHRLYVRVGQLLISRGIPYNENNMEIQHVKPAGEVFRVWPVPYFKVRNAYMRRWCGLILVSLSEAMQHTENRKELEISPSFTGQIGQYFTRVYFNMATELFGIAREDAIKDGFLLTEEQLLTYDPTKFFTSTELVDTVPRLDRVFTEDRLELLNEGIPVTKLPADLRPWPNNLTDLYTDIREDSSISNSSGGEIKADSTTQQTLTMPKPIGP